MLEIIQLKKRLQMSGYQEEMFYNGHYLKYRNERSYLLVWNIH